jgi:hypothetical protein
VHEKLGAIAKILAISFLLTLSRSLIAFDLEGLEEKPFDELLPHQKMIAVRSH